MRGSLIERGATIAGSRRKACERLHTAKILTLTFSASNFGRWMSPRFVSPQTIPEKLNLFDRVSTDQNESARAGGAVSAGDSIHLHRV